MRIKNRKWGWKSNEGALQATHLIKIGFDKRPPSAIRPVPGKLAGFLICRDSLGPDNNPIIDMEAMIALGSDAAKIAKAKAAELKAEPGLLPTDLHFVLTHDAVPSGEGWGYPGTYNEEYACWNKDGKFCFGNGVTAQRKEADGTRRVIDCVPVGRANTCAKEFCSFSVKKECKANGQLVLCLWKEGANGKPEPLSRALGFQTRYLVETSSDNFGPRVLSELDLAADRTHGILHGITGILSLQKQRKRYQGKEGGAVGISGQLMFTLSDSDISRREQEVRNWMLQDRATPTLQLPAPATTEEPDDPFEDDGEPADAQDAPEAAATPATAPAGGQPVEVPPQAPPEPPAAQEAPPAPLKTGVLTKNLETLMAQEPPVQVADRIHAHVLAIVERDGGNYTDTLNDVCFGSPDGLYNAKKKTFTRIANADEFLRGDTERQRIQRLKLLYEIGLRIAIDGDPAAEPDEPPDLFEDGEKGAGK